ncbi:MAG: ABC transporter substrate-binding protein, partial [Clostridia bacterium]
MLCAALVLSCFGGCKADEKEIVKVRVNEVTHSIFYAPQYVAMEMGFFKDEGLEIELTNGGGSNVSMTAVISGQADIGLMGPETAIYVYNEGRKDFPLVFGQLTKRDGSFLISKKNEVPFDYKNLEG